jgi:hypothetical protein
MATVSKEMSGKNYVFAISSIYLNLIEPVKTGIARSFEMSAETILRSSVIRKTRECTDSPDV